MGQLNRLPRYRNGFLMAGLVAVLGVGAGGCRHSDVNSGASASPPPVATANNAPDQGFQSNPNIPPQVKAAIAAHEHGKSVNIAPAGK